MNPLDTNETFSGRNKQRLSRRQFFAAIAAGGVVTAAGLWMPGNRLISIPKSISMTATGVRLRHAAYYEMMAERMDKIINPLMIEAYRDLVVFGHSKLDVKIEGDTVTVSRIPLEMLPVEIKTGFRK